MNNYEINRMMKELAVCSVSSFEAWMVTEAKVIWINKNYIKREI